jgi:O-antigen/teichoic acid export membrane protein
LGVGTGYLQAALTTACNLWLARFLLTRLGEESFGGWLVLGQLLLYADLLDLGVVALLPREVASAAGAAGNEADRFAAVGQLTSAAQRLILWQLPLPLAAAGVFWWLASVSGEGLALPALVASLAVVVLFPCRVYPAVLQGLQDLGALGWLNLAGWAVQTLLTVTLILAGLGLWGLVIAWCAQRAFLAVAFRLRLQIAFPRVLRSSAAPAAASAPRLVSRGLWATAGRLAQNLMNGSELLLLAPLVDASAVVVYACTSKLISVFALQVYGAALAAEPAISELRSAGDKARLVRVLTAVRQFTLLLSGLLACVVLVTNEGFVAWWVGQQRYGGLTMTALLVVVALVRHSTFTLAHALFCCRYEKMLTLLYLAEAAVTLGSTAAFVAWLGPVGTPLGLMSGVVLVGWPTYLYYLRRELGVCATDLLRDHAGWLCRFVLLAVPLTVAAWLWQPRGVFELTLAGSLTVLLYAVVMWPVVRSQPLADYVRPRLEALRRILRRTKPDASVAPDVPAG